MWSKDKRVAHPENWIMLRQLTRALKELHRWLDGLVRGKLVVQGGGAAISATDTVD